jgi:hypothetical protein
VNYLVNTVSCAIEGGVPPSAPTVNFPSKIKTGRPSNEPQRHPSGARKILAGPSSNAADKRLRFVSP